MFQGSATNLKTWNEYTDSKFLDRLKELGSVYTYQDKIYNILYYDESNAERKDFGSDIDFDLSYVVPDTHIKMVYDDIQSKYEDVEEYKLIPVGWSAGGYLALYFAQVYSSQCSQVVLLDSALWTPENLEKRLHNLDKGIYPLQDAKLKKMLQDWKANPTDVEDAYTIITLCNYIRSLYISRHLKLELSVSTLSFVNIQEPEKDEWNVDFNNERRLKEVQILKEHNPEMYNAFVFINKTHHIFNMIQPAKKIIKEIQRSILNRRGSKKRRLNKSKKSKKNYLHRRKLK